MSVEASWSEFVDGLRRAGEQLAHDSADLDPLERADGYRALLRAVNNQLGRWEVDRERPELVAFNGWREKFLMDNPDFRYWVADIRDDRRYRVTGNVGDSVYQSLTVYAGEGMAVSAASRVDSDDLAVDSEGGFAVTISADEPEGGDWLPLPARATALWVRHFHERPGSGDEHGWCRIDPIDAPPAAPRLSPETMERRLGRLGAGIVVMPRVFATAVIEDAENPNQMRHWSEMSGGAVFTEPGIHYLRGAWELDPDEALVIEGPVVPARYWNVMLYSRYLNSLDYRHRSVSRTSATALVTDGRYRFVVAARDPGGDHDWLDTEGRRFGLIVMRWLQPEETPELPAVRRCPLDRVSPVS